HDRPDADRPVRGGARADAEDLALVDGVDHALREAALRRRFPGHAGAVDEPGAARPTSASRVPSSPGKKHSIRSSCSVTSCGVPKVVRVEKKRSWRPPHLYTIVTSGAGTLSSSGVRQRGGTPG